MNMIFKVLFIGVSVIAIFIVLLIFILYITKRGYLVHSFLDYCLDFGYRADPCYNASMYNCMNCKKKCKYHNISIMIDQKYSIKEEN